YKHTQHTETSTLSLHDALPIYVRVELEELHRQVLRAAVAGRGVVELAGLLLHEVDEFAHRLCRHLRVDVHAKRAGGEQGDRRERSEEHTSELQSLRHLVCRLLL